MKTIFTCLSIIFLALSTHSCKKERSMMATPLSPVSPPKDFQLKELVVYNDASNPGPNGRHYRLHYNTAAWLDSISIFDNPPGNFRAAYHIRYKEPGRIDSVTYWEKNNRIAIGTAYQYNTNGEILSYEYWDTQQYINTPKPSGIRIDDFGRITVLPNGDSLFYDNGYNFVRQKDADGTIINFEYEYRANPLYYVKDWGTILLQEPWFYQLAITPNNIRVAKRQGSTQIATYVHTYDEKNRLIRKEILSRNMPQAKLITYTYY